MVIRAKAKDDERAWAEIQTMGLDRTLGRDQFFALIGYLEAQARGGEMWPPKYWIVLGWSRPETSGRLSHRLRIRLQNRKDAHDRRTLVWWNTVKWKRLKQ